MIGTQLGSYEILSPLGKGGMGEVWRARDSKLGREVAIKTLPEEFAKEEERLARFEREAKLLASLNHPNIATIHGLEESDGTRFLVLELVEGDTLADRLKRGAIPVEESLKLALQIAEALEAAHGKGVIHRDLKPANIKVTPEGKVKVLDFGLAKAFAVEASGADLSRMPTATLPEPTLEGTIRGTPAYMSPEQVRGDPVDTRTDIWAFGCVLYEVLTGRRAFAGETVGDIFAHLMRDDPDWSSLPKTLPYGVRKLVERCLQKDRNRRLHHMADARIEIGEAVTGPADEAPSDSDRPTERRRWIALPAVALLAGLVVGGIITAVATWNEPDPANVVRTELVLPIRQQLAIRTPNPAVLVSPDGSHFVYSTFPDSGGLLLRPLDAPDMKAIEVGAAFSLVFSPDGVWVAYRGTNTGLMKVPITGGAPVAIPGPYPFGGITWGEGGDLVIAPDLQSALWTASADGGEPKELTTLADGETSHRLPKFLPGGRAVLFTVWTEQQSGEDGQIAVYSFDDASTRILLPGTQPQYAPTRHLVYAQGNRILAVPFDPARLEVTGTPVPVVENVLRGKQGVSQFSFSDTGLLMYVPGDVAEPRHRLVWVDREGRTELVRGLPAGPYAAPRLSPEGNHIAWFSGGGFGAFDIWVHDLVTGDPRRATSDGYRFANMLPVWNPDGAELTFERIAGLQPDIYSIRVDGSGGDRQLTSSNDSTDIPGSYSPDGTLAFSGTRTGIGSGILVLSAGGVEEFLVTPAGAMSPMFSPNGRSIAYVSDEAGRNEIFVQPYPSTSGSWTKISSEGGTDPVWTRNGREVYYRSDSTMMAVQITTDPLGYSTPQPLFPEDRFRKGPGPGTSYDVAADGRFLMVEEDPDDSVRVIVVQNWFEELKELVPAP